MGEKRGTKMGHEKALKTAVRTDDGTQGEFEPRIDTGKRPASRLFCPLFSFIFCSPSSSFAHHLQNVIN